MPFQNSSVQNCLAFVLYLFLSASVSAQGLKLEDAKTFADVAAYLQQERSKLNTDASVKESALFVANLLLPASAKLLEVAQNDMERRSAYNMKLQALQNQIVAEVEGARERYDTYLKELATHQDEDARNFAATYQFGQLRSIAMRTAGRAASPATFNEFKSELKRWLNQAEVPVEYISSLGLPTLAERNNVPPKRFIEELVTFVQSPECTVSTEKKKELTAALEGLLLLLLGSDPQLYGRTLDDKEFVWEDLLKKDSVKYILIKFTATWCPPCQMEIPGMLDAYEKYHNKGLEIISVYIFQENRGDATPLETVKNYVKEKKLPWIVISETLSVRAKHPEYGKHYGIPGVPEMVLVNKEGKIIMTNARGVELRKKLEELFK